MTFPSFLPDGPCPKCHHDELRTIYHADTHRPCSEHDNHREPECCTLEHLHRFCARCGFDWPEACA